MTADVLPLVSVSQLLSASLVVCGASMIKGAIGFGFPLVAVPLLSALLGPRVAIPVVAIPTLFSNVLVIRGIGLRPEGRPLWGLLAGIAVGTAAGAALLRWLDPRLASALVGAVALAYAVAGALRLTVRIPPPSARRTGPLLGLAAGLLGGATGISSPLLAVYLHVLRLDKRAFVFWITMTFFVVNIVQIATYLRLGLYPRPVLAVALVTCAPMVIGTLLGLALHRRLPAQTFERIVLGLVFLASVHLLVRSFG
jgi:uncharacterized membrane protein YfcA